MLSGLTSLGICGALVGCGGRWEMRVCAGRTGDISRAGAGRPMRRISLRHRNERHPLRGNPCACNELKGSKKSDGVNITTLTPKITAEHEVENKIAIQGVYTRRVKETSATGEHCTPWNA